MPSGHYRWLHSLAQRAKNIFKDRAKVATPEEADKMEGPKQSYQEILNEKQHKEWMKSVGK